MSLNFLYQLHNRDHGFLPNYGNNDGALFFPLNNQPFFDFRPQINSLHYALFKTHLYNEFQIREDASWFGADSSPYDPKLNLTSLNHFQSGGYFSFRDNQSISFIRCGNHINRPGQADNLHLDISLNDKPLLRDAGSYQYNAEPEIVNYFSGTKSHNTIMLGDADQMQKAGRFIWLHWSEAKLAYLKEEEDWIIFEGRILAFKHIGKDIQHVRRIRKKKNNLHWEIEDQIINKPIHFDMVQIWHPNPEFTDRIIFTSNEVDDKPISSTRFKNSGLKWCLS